MTASVVGTATSSPWHTRHRAHPVHPCLLRQRTITRGSRLSVERPWRTIEYAEVYRHAYATVSEARAGIGRYLALHNTRRRHSRLAATTPVEADLLILRSPLRVAA